MNPLYEDAFEIDDIVDEVEIVTRHMKDSIEHGEPLDLTFIDGEEFVSLDVHTMQYILNKGMVEEMLDAADTTETFQLFLDKLFFNVDE